MTPRASLPRVLAMVLDVWFGPQYVGNFFLRPRRDGLVGLDLWDGRFIRARNALLG